MESLLEFKCYHITYHSPHLPVNETRVTDCTNALTLWWQTHTNSANAAVAVWIFVQILLVVVLGIIERTGVGNFSRDVSLVSGERHRLLEACKTCAGGGILFWR